MKLRAIALAAILAAAALPATAGRCITTDRWSGTDKDKHAAAGLAIGAAVATFTDGNRWAGFLAGAGVGLVTELYAAGSGRGVCSLQDFATTAVGAAIGAQLGPFAASVRRDGWAVAYRTTF